MSSASGKEWFPTFGVSWHVVQVPTICCVPVVNPGTSLIVSCWVLNICSPRAIEACCELCEFYHDV